MSEDVREVVILLVEDHRADIALTKRALRKAKIKNKLYVAMDGVEALAYLRREGRFASVPRPDLVLLDLNMPRKSGRDVLREMKADETLRTIPVVVLTTSSDEKDVVESYGLNANAYVVKPVDYEKFMSAMLTIESFWFALVRLPGRV